MGKHCVDKAIGKLFRYSFTNAEQSFGPSSDIARVFKDNDVILTTYHEVRNSFNVLDHPDSNARKRSILHRTSFNRVVLDEAQQIKNRDSQISKACRALKSKYRWAISGTPITNSPSEIFPYFSFLRHPDATSYDSFHKKFFTSDGENGDGCRPELSLELSNFMIRRIHQDTFLGGPILSLPKCESRTIPLRFSEPELSFYEDYEAEANRKISKLLKNSKKNKNAPAVRKQILIWFQRLRQLVSHFLLVGHDLPKYLADGDLVRLIQVAHESSGTTSRDKLQELHDGIANKSSVDFPPEPLDPSKKTRSAKFSFKKWMKNTDGAIMLSTKMRATVDQIGQWLQENPAKKIIVFAEFVDILDHLNIICSRNGWDSTVFHGSMSPKARSNALSQYQHNAHKQILLCSLKLGGVGLNLTAACRVIIYDIWWNSAVEQQAFCRVYRVGQTQETELVRFKIDGTIDDRLLKKQKEKEEEVKKCIKPEKGGVMQMLSTSELAQLVSGFNDSDNVDDNVNDDYGDSDDDDDHENGQSTSESSSGGFEDSDEMEEEYGDPDNVYQQDVLGSMQGPVNTSSSLFIPGDDNQPTHTGHTSATVDVDAFMRNAESEPFVDVDDPSFQDIEDDF